MTQPIRMVTIAELREKTGERGTRIWIARNGAVYDVTDSPRWRTGLHKFLHFGGQDLASEFPEAPHGAEVFLHHGVTLIGRLVAE